jgi:aspartate/methionine/tyrosine aminotransferase
VSHTGAWRYAPPAGLPPLRRLLAERAEAAHGVRADPSWVTVTAGASLGLAAVIAATTQPGEAVLCPDPGYPAFAGLTRRLGRRVVWYPATGLGGHADPQVVEQCITPDTRLLIWNSPSNPLGTMAAAHSAAAVAELTHRHGLALASDEVYADLCYEGRPASPLAHGGDRCCAIVSFSKSYALAGFRIGAVVAPPPLAAAVTGAHWSLGMSASTAGQHAALGALAAPDSYLADLRVTLRQRRDEVAALYQSAHIPHELPQSGLFFWLDIGATGQDADGFASSLAAETGVRVSSGAAFGPSGARSVRVSFGGRDDESRRGATLLAGYYAKHDRGAVVPR